MLFTLKQNIFLLLASSILATATAQDSSAQDDLPTSSAPPDPSPYPTATIFLPGSLHELPGGGRNLAASVITAVSLIAINIIVYVTNFLTFLRTRIKLHMPLVA